jgi:hypothetical protein
VHNCAGYGIQMVVAEVFSMGIRAGVEPLALWEALRTGASGRQRTFDRLYDRFLRPVVALEQVRRLLAPGGVVGARDVDWGSTTFFPENEGMRRFLKLYGELAQRNGGQANAGRFMRRWFREAGFKDVTITTSTWSFANDAAVAEWAHTCAERTLTSNIAAKSLEYGLASRSDLESIADGWRVWDRDPDAIFCFAHTEIVARPT